LFLGLCGVAVAAYTIKELIIMLKIRKAEEKIKNFLYNLLLHITINSSVTIISNKWG
tara:strand:+ start:257 stop:427 length:171 start_codon:yes stop_codon:yes gene_type:complete